MSLTSDIRDGDVAPASWANAVQHALGSGSPSQLPAYVISVASGTYTARNGLTGEIDYSGTNANTVVQSVIDGLTSGGLIVFMEGTFTFTVALTIDLAYITIAGQGPSTVLDWGTADVIGFDVNDDHFTLRNVKIDQNHSGTYGSDAVNIDGNGDFTTIEYVSFVNANRSAVYCSGDDCIVQYCHVESAGGHGIFAQECARPKFLYNFVEDVDDTSLEFYYLVTDGLMDGNTGVLSGDAVDFIAVQGSQRCTISNNKATEIPRYGILIGNEGDADTDCDDITVTGNMLWSDGAGARDAGICVEGKATTTCHHITIANNRVNNTFVEGIKVYGVSGFLANWLNITGNTITCSNIGIVFDGAALMSEHCNVTGNVVSPGGTVGFKGDYINNCTVADNMFDVWGFAYFGVMLTNSDNNKIDGNHIFLNEAGSFGISVDTDSDSNHIHGNVVTAPTGLTITNANCNTNFVDGNNFDACTVDVVDAGTGTIWGANLDQTGTWDQGAEP